jgi:hypothetical protein
MAHLSSIAAAMFSDLSVSSTVWTGTAYTETVFDGYFAAPLEPTVAPAAASYYRIKNVREFPAVGTPPNIVKVPVYGQKISQQIQGQADAPNLEIKINYIATEWDASTSKLAAMIGDGKKYVFRFALLASEPEGYNATAATAAGSIASSKVDNAATCENTSWYWIGSIAAIQTTPSLTDSTQATLTLTLQSDFYGAFTVD